MSGVVTRWSCNPECDAPSAFARPAARQAGPAVRPTFTHSTRSRLELVERLGLLRAGLSLFTLSTFTSLREFN